MSVKVFRGDCREILRTLPSESVHAVVTSPPYWGLRDYGIPPSVWGGDPACEHEWGALIQSRDVCSGNGRDNSTLDGGRNTYDGQPKHWRGESTFCRCGAWRGAFGLEPTYQLYVEHAVEVFREVRRVLRKDGTVWLNLGDSYATSPPGNKPGTGHASSGLAGVRKGSQYLDTLENYYKGQRNKRDWGGLKPKDLVGVPWRVAFALQDDGWWLRQDIIWSKPGPMPESVTDRCTKAHEYLFLLTKSERYYYDNIAIAERSVSSVQAERARASEDSGIPQERQEQANPIGMEKVRRGRGVNAQISPVSEAQIGLEEALRQRETEGIHPALPSDCERAREFASWGAQAAGSDGGDDLRFDGGSVDDDPEESGFQMRPLRSAKTTDSRSHSSALNGWAAHSQQHSGSMPKLQQQEEQQAAYRNRRSVWHIATEPYAGAHFAVMPSALVEPCILAGCPKECCSECGAPWVREVEEAGRVRVREGSNTSAADSVIAANGQIGASSIFRSGEKTTHRTLGFAPSCSCDAGTTAGTCLDPFGGAGTTGLVADRLQRNAILIELNPEYAEMAERRITGDAPLFAQVSA